MPPQAEADRHLNEEVSRPAKRHAVLAGLFRADLPFNSCDLNNVVARSGTSWLSAASDSRK